MLTPFPGFLMFEFFAPTILRIAAAIIFAYLAYRHFEHRREAGRISLPIIGRAAWVIWLAIVVEVLVAAALFFGYYTQIAALIGALGALKQWVWRGTYPSFFWLTRSASFLLLVICLSLLLTGAGAFAFDLRL